MKTVATAKDWTRKMLADYVKGSTIFFSFMGIDLSPAAVRR